MRAYATLALLALAATAHAAGFSQPSPDYKTIPAGVYQADPAHSSVTFRIAHMGLSNFVGRFNNVDAQLILNPQAPANVNMSGRVLVANIDTANPELDKILRSSTFFDAERFPTIKLVAKSLQLTGPTSGTLNADLTMHGVTRPLALKVVFHGHGPNYEGTETLGFSANATLRRSAFGMAGFTPALGDEVDIWLEAEFIKKP